MVENYYLEKCKYMLGSLKPFIYVLPKSTTQVSYYIDNYNVTDNAYIGRCEVMNINATEVIKIVGFKTVANVVESVDNRLQFSSKVTLSMREQYEKPYILLLNQLRLMGNAYIVVEDNMGKQYIQSPEMAGTFGYTYTFDTASNNVAELSYGCDCNNPLVLLNNNIEPTQLIDLECEYNNGGVRNFKMTPYKYAYIDSDAESGEFSTITCTGGERMHDVEFIPQTFSFRQSYDGQNYQERIIFRIPLSEYKHYFTYNLVAFMQNRYAITFSTPQNNWIAAGFEFGFLPTYTIETSENLDELNIIEFTLYHSGQNSIFYCEGEPTFVTSVTEIYVPVTRPIIDPNTGLEVASWFCIDNKTAIYALAQMVTESGVATDSYICLEQYEEYYRQRGVNIVGTYTENDDLGFELTFANYECALENNCKFEKMTKEVYVYTESGQYYEAHILSPCAWELRNIPSWITASRLSGDGGLEYVVRFTCTEDPTDIIKIAFSQLISGANTSTIQFILEDKVDWINPIEHHIDARAQQVVSYIALDFNDYEICEIPDGLTAEKVRSNSTVRIWVPENRSESLQRFFQVKICRKNGQYGYIYIYQDHLYTRWGEEIGTYICEYGNSYKKMKKYKGYTPDNINIPTGEYKMGEMLEENDARCKFDGSDGAYYVIEWRTTGETICIIETYGGVEHKNLYTKLRKWESYDEGETWEETDQYKQGELIQEDSSECSDLPQRKWKWLIDRTLFDCVGDNSYYYECYFWSYDMIEWYKTEETDCRLSNEIKMENDPDCGGGTIPEYYTKWVLSTEDVYCNENDGYLYYMERLYTSLDGVNWEATNSFRATNISTGVRCGETVEYEYTWVVDEGSYMCDENNTATSYYVERYYKYDVRYPENLILVMPEQTRQSETVYRENDPECGYVPQRLYRWNTDGTICNGEDLYERQDYEYSDNQGQTWTKTGESRYGQLIETSSSQCVNPQYYEKWVIDRTRWQCFGVTSYYYQVKYISQDNSNWVKKMPEEIQIVQSQQTMRLQNDPDCGSGGTIYRWIDDGEMCDYDDNDPMIDTRWVIMPRSSWICVGTDLYSTEKKQIRENNGEWTDTDIIRIGTVYEENASRCN